MVSLTGAQVPLSGAQYDISAGDYQATVTELGAGLRLLRHRGQPVITEYEADVLPPAGAGQLLCPWPNRVDGGRYATGGVQHQLALSEPANQNAIHGLTRWAGWATAAAHRPAGQPAARAARPPGLPVLPGAGGQLPARRRPRPAGQHHRPERRLGARALWHRLSTPT